MSAQRVVAVHQAIPPMRWRLPKLLFVLGIPVAMIGGFIASVADPKLGMGIFLTGWGMAAIGYAFFTAFENLALIRLIQDLPTSLIRSAHQGFVELHGIVRAGGPEGLQCPKCHKPCLWFQYATRKSALVKPTGRVPPILLDDGTGLCLIQPGRAEVFSAHSHDMHVHICEHDTLYALGEFRAQKEPPPTAELSADEAQRASFRERQETVLRQLQQIKYDKRLQSTFDVNRDGKVDAREWEAARRAIELKVQREGPAPPPPRPESMLVRPTTEADRLPFLLFVGTEEDAIKTTRGRVLQRAVLAALFGLVLATFVFMLVILPPP